MGCAFFAGFVNFCGDVSARALAAHGSVVIPRERSDRKNFCHSEPLAGEESHGERTDFVHGILSLRSE